MLPSRRENIFFFFISLLWVLLLYARSIGAPFAAYDDPGNILHNAALQTWSGALKYWYSPGTFTRDLLGNGQSYYRPLTWLSFAIDRHLWGLNAEGFHLTNVVLHFLNGFVVFMLLRRLGVALIVASATVLLWLALPINSEAVAWISARSYCVAGLFLAGGALLAHRYLLTKKVAALAGYCMCALCALLSHEAGILIVPLTLLIAYATAEKRGRSAMYLLSALVAAGASYALLREVVGGSAPLRFLSLETVGLYFFKYAGWIVLPIHMSIERSTNVPSHGLSSAAVLAWAALCALGLFAFAIRRIAPAVGAGIAWTIFALIPFCGITFIYQGMAERFTYFASVGVMLAVVSGMSLLMKKTRGEGRRRWLPVSFVLLVIVCAWALWGVGRLWSREGDWSDPVSLYEHSLMATPHSAKLFHNLGDYYMSQGDLDGAESNYRKALERDPNDADLAIDLGAAFEKAGDLPAARREYLHAIAINPHQDDAYCNLGVLLFEDGDADVSAQLFSRAIAISPKDPIPYNDLAAVYQSSGRIALAVQLYKNVLQFDPGNADATMQLKKLGAR